MVVGTGAALVVVVGAGTGTTVPIAGAAVSVVTAVDSVVAKGVAYFSAAGNDASNAYDNTAPSFATLSNTGSTAGEYLLNVDNSGATNTPSLSVDIPALKQGYLVAVVLQWDQPYVTGAPGSPGRRSRRRPRTRLRHARRA